MGDEPMARLPANRSADLNEVRSLNADTIASPSIAVPIAGARSVPFENHFLCPRSDTTWRSNRSPARKFARARSSRARFRRKCMSGIGHAFTNAQPLFPLSRDANNRASRPAGDPQARPTTTPTHNDPDPQATHNPGRNATRDPKAPAAPQPALCISRFEPQRGVYTTPTPSPSHMPPSRCATPFDGRYGICRSTRPVSKPALRRTCRLKRGSKRATAAARADQVSF